MSGFGAELQNSNNNGECLDLSSKRAFVLVFFAVSDPGYEYEIFSGEDLECSSWCCIREGGPVGVRYGAARTRGVIVKVSDTLKYLKKNFKKLTKMHQESLKNGEAKIIPKKEYILQNRSYIESMNHMKTDCQIPKKEFPLGKKYVGPKGEVLGTKNKGTQTDTPLQTLDPYYVDLERKYDEIKIKYEKMHTLVSDLQNNMENSLSRMTNFSRNSNEDNAYSSSCEEEKENFSKMIQIGSKGTRISKHIYDIINWSSYTAATRKLLITLFSRKVLATHSLTGKPSPAFLSSEKEAKARLDPTITSDIVEVVSKKSKVTESQVRSAITTKCADENKLYKKRLQRGSDEDEDVASLKRKWNH